MKYPYPRIVYYGTPEFAVPALSALLEFGYHVVAVVTAADKPSGRGMKLQMSAVKEKALELGIPVLQPENLSDPVFLQQLLEFDVELQVVVAFRKLPDAVWKLPKLGTFNLHASLLPQYRGAAPINWVLINGEQQTGLSTFFIDDKIDTGSVILQQAIPVEEDDDAGILHDRLMGAGAQLILRTMELIASGHVEAQAQNQLAAGVVLKSAPKLNKENCRINWKHTAADIRNFVRGLSPYPAATAVLMNGDEAYAMKVFKAVPVVVGEQKSPGILDTDGRTYLHVYTADSCISLLEIQLAGKKRMGVADFLRGFVIATDAFFVIFE